MVKKANNNTATIEKAKIEKCSKNKRNRKDIEFLNEK